MQAHANEATQKREYIQAKIVQESSLAVSQPRDVEPWHVNHHILLSILCHVLVLAKADEDYLCVDQDAYNGNEQQCHYEAAFVEIQTAKPDVLGASGLAYQSVKC